ncbi:hypothetical protein TNCV_2828651 [Trichonephila clavipes]|nr:hypothetical protein TNCV_2828651 [Trichonephila clavipes]
MISGRVKSFPPKGDISAPTMAIPMVVNLSPYGFLHYKSESWNYTTVQFVKTSLSCAPKKCAAPPSMVVMTLGL